MGERRENKKVREGRGREKRNSKATWLIGFTKSSFVPFRPLFFFSSISYCVNLEEERVRGMNERINEARKKIYFADFNTQFSKQRIY